MIFKADVIEIKPIVHPNMAIYRVGNFFFTDTQEFVDQYRQIIIRDYDTAVRELTDAIRMKHVEIINFLMPLATAKQIAEAMSKAK